MENLLNKQEVCVSALSDQGSRRTYVTQRVKNILQLAPICTERITISTFGNKECESKNFENLSVHLRNSKGKLEVEALSTRFTCLPIQKQSSNFAKEIFDYLKELELANSKPKSDTDLLIGSDLYWLLVTGHVKFGNPRKPLGVETKFGAQWSLEG